MADKQALEQLVTNGVRFPQDLRVPKGAQAPRSPREAAVLMLFGEHGNGGGHGPLGVRGPVGVRQPGGASERPGDGLDVLLLQRSAKLRHHPGQVSFPGGGIDLEDSGPVSAALREANEEAALNPSSVQVLGQLERVFLPNSNNLVTPVLSWWEERGQLIPDGVETQQVLNVPVAELLNPEARATGVLQRGGVTHTGPTFLLGSGREEIVVWGFTALLLDALFDETGWTQPWDRQRTYNLNKQFS